MSYPTLEQYNEAFQYPQHALADSVLKRGSVATTGLGLPRALCGGFALTYTIKAGTDAYAVRCFHKQSNALEKRYSSISACLKQLHSPYFVDFEFQPQGVRVGGKAFPIVKMAWASGVTLGEFLEKNYRHPKNLENLWTSLRNLATYLDKQRIAHGDVQPGNVMVADSGKTLQLIDYDGMFVEELRSLGSAELGHRNFQHPKRSSKSWNASLDRFSFIGIDVALRVLASHPEFWAKSQSDGDAIIFKANDFANPNQSPIFLDLIGRHGFSDDAKSLAAICKSPYDRTPTLKDFLAARNIPSAAISLPATRSAEVGQYLSAFRVLDATNYTLCKDFVGEKVELIGRVAEVKQGKTRQGKPYVFINFGPWRGEIVKISVWSEGLAALNERPNANWRNRWISVIGLLEPPYVNSQYNYSHIAISITQGSQIHFISKVEAAFRLAGSSTRSSDEVVSTSNRDILVGLRRDDALHQTGLPQRATSYSKAPSSAPATSNKAVLQRIRSGQQAPVPASNSRPAPRYPSTPRSIPQRASRGKPNKQPSSSSSDCFIATAVFGGDAPETNALRAWRDRCLLSSCAGRLLVVMYYRISPALVPILNRHSRLRDVVRSILRELVSVVSH